MQFPLDTPFFCWTSLVEPLDNRHFIMGKHEYRPPASGLIIHRVLVLISIGFVFSSCIIERFLRHFIGSPFFFMRNPAFLDGKIYIDNKRAVKPVPEHFNYQVGADSVAF